MTEFKSSNGFTVILNGGTLVATKDAEKASRMAYSGYGTGYQGAFFDVGAIDAIREFFDTEKSK